MRYRFRFFVALCAGALTLRAQIFLRRDLPVADRPSRVVVGDFNGDGRADLAVNSYSGLAVHLNLGGGRFARPVTTPGAVHPSFGPEPSNYTVAADFNGDGWLDLAGAVEPRAGRVLLGRGDGTFTSRDIGPAAFAAATGDFNGDRIPDLLVMQIDESSRQQTLVALLGDGSGSFRQGGRIGNATGRTCVADFNRDGLTDVAMDDTRGTLSVWLSGADGSFRPPIQTREAAAGVVADFNRDGVPDIASASEVLLGKGDGTFQPVRYLPSRRGFSTPFAAADFDGDGFTDLAGWLYDEGAGNSIQVFRGRGDGSLGLPVDYVAGWQAAGDTAGDLDGDGRPELIAVNFRMNAVTLLMPRVQGGPILNRAVSAAGGRAIVAPESLATLYLTTGVAAVASASAPYPEQMGGISLAVRDSAGVSRPAPILFVSPTQVNFQVPAGTAAGEASLVVTSDRGSSTAGGMEVAAAAPGLFLISEANSTPAALGIRVGADGRQSPVSLFNCFGPQRGQFSCAPATIRLGGDAVYLSFFGTGFRGANTTNVACMLNGVRLPVEFAGPQGPPGIDQINIRLLPEAVLQGPAFLTLEIDGVPANPALLQIAR